MVVRDGAYVCDFQLTPEDVTELVGHVVAAGLDLVEVGHGIGLGGGARAPAAASDEEYLTAAAAARGSAELGVIMLPRFAGPEQIALATRFAEHLHFARVGPDADDLEPAWPIVEGLLEGGVRVALNLLKTYLVTPIELAAALPEVRRRGVDTVYLVDSAGHLMPEQVRAYAEVVVGEGFTLGFHGHDNLRLAVANSLAAADAGASYLDSSLAGIGRGAGNTQTEILALALHRQGHYPAPDLGAMVRAGDACSARYGGRTGVSSQEILMGASGQHTAFLPNLVDLAAKHDLSLEVVLVRAATHGWCTVEQVIDGLAEPEE
jgi:isopropylmalate/homocitrate/citramalate synthase